MVLPTQQGEWAAVLGSGSWGKWGHQSSQLQRQSFPGPGTRLPSLQGEVLAAAYPHFPEAQPPQATLWDTGAPGSLLPPRSLGARRITGAPAWGGAVPGAVCTMQVPSPGPGLLGQHP